MSLLLLLPPLGCGVTGGLEDGARTSGGLWGPVGSHLGKWSEPEDFHMSLMLGKREW